MQSTTMGKTGKLFGKAAALTAVIGAATGLFWAAIAWFNKQSDKSNSQKNNE